jgi:hypothetical protein
MKHPRQDDVIDKGATAREQPGVLDPVDAGTDIARRPNRRTFAHL